MALKIIANYSKRLGLPSYSSHQFSITVETELNNTDDVKLEASRLYKTLQSAVDREIQSTGFVPGDEYGADSGSVPAKQAAPKPSQEVQWKASDKQKQLIMRLMQDNGLELEEVEALAAEMFSTSNLPALNKIQVSGLIDELLARYGKQSRRDQAPANRWQRRAAR